MNRPAKKSKLKPVPQIDSAITAVRGRRVIFDADLALIYGVATKALNQAVRRNRDRFPDDFLFRLTRAEARRVMRSRSQFVTLKRGGNIKYSPFAFTEHGALMAANVLKSQKAKAMSVFVVRAFVRLREVIADNRTMAAKLDELERSLTGRLDGHEQTILEIVEELRRLTSPPDPNTTREIGFHVHEVPVPYRPNRKVRPGPA